jgi:microcystin-dependent protein
MFLSPNSRVTGGKAARRDFPAGTQLSFLNAAAPVGWVRVSAFDDALLRIVGSAAPGSGGSNGFVATFNSQTVTGAHTLTAAEIPAHTHNVAGTVNNSVGGSTYVAMQDTLTPRTATTDNGTGGGGAHTHTIATAIKYVDALIARKS